MEGLWFFLPFYIFGMHLNGALGCLQEYLEGGLWIAIGSAARICDSTFNLIDKILAFFLFFLLYRLEPRLISTASPKLERRIW